MQPIPRLVTQIEFGTISVATISTLYAPADEKLSSRQRDLIELILGYGLIMVILWLPTRAQVLLSPIALAFTLSVVLMYRPSLKDLGLGIAGLSQSLWILPVAVVFTGVGLLMAQKIGTLHPLYQADLVHVGGYVLWTCYQQFLLQDYFMPRLSRLIESQSAAVALTAGLFAVAHLPNPALTAVTLVWGALSSVLFLRYRNLYVLGLAQGILGLCFAICVPDALHHHMRVGLGFLYYHAALLIH